MWKFNELSNSSELYLEQQKKIAVIDFDSETISITVKNLPIRYLQGILNEFNEAKETNQI